MNIQVTFSHCSDDPRKLSRNPSGSTTVTLTNVYGGLSSMTPVIICDIDPDGDHFDKNFFNYMMIGNLCYWIIDATYTPQEHWIFSLKKDLIGSYLDQLLNCDAIATRTNTGEYSFITDSQVPIQNSTKIHYMKSTNIIGPDNTFCYVLTVAGSGVMALDDAATQVAQEKQAAQQLLSKESDFYDTLIAYFTPQP